MGNWKIPITNSFACNGSGEIVMSLKTFLISRIVFQTTHMITKQDVRDRKCRKIRFFGFITRVKRIFQTCYSVTSEAGEIYCSWCSNACNIAMHA